MARSECKYGRRPCLFVSCKYNLYLDVDPKTGSIKFNFPDLEPDEMVESCALDIADRGGEILENVGLAINMTRERVRQIEEMTTERLRFSDDAIKLLEHVEFAAMHAVG